MKQSYIPHHPIILSVAGSDCSGMAGIQMDIRTLSALGGHATTAITANTAQNNEGILSSNPVSNQALIDQLTAVSALGITSIKSGVLCDRSQINALVSYVKNISVPFVIDPVLAATSGKAFSAENLAQAIASNLLPLCTLVTPNLAEAEKLSGQKITTAEDMEEAAKKLQRLGAKNVLIKGGHAQFSSYSQDYFLGTERQFWLSSPRINTDNTRGTGCALSSAIACVLAAGHRIEDAVVIGKMAVNQGLRNGYSASSFQGGISKGPVSVSEFPHRQDDLPVLSSTHQVDLDIAKFPGCAEERPLGLYPCVDSADWIERLIPQGVSTIQLRNKDLTGDALENEVSRAITIARKSNCRLFINDYWELAIKHGAYGVHLGQEDLNTADIEAIKQAGLRLGLSSHCHYEVARAQGYKPSYIACGPVYHTNTKQMPWIPHGLDRLSYWNNLLDYPLVGIGGISRDRMEGVANTGVSGISLITAITLAKDPEAAAAEMIEAIRKIQGQA